MSKKTEFERIAVGTLKPKSTFTYGGVNWLVLGKSGDGVLCLAEKILFKKAFDENNCNNWEDSSLREHLNNDFLEQLINAGAAEGNFLPMFTDLTADDGLKDYDRCEDIISLISCQQYRQYRNIITNADDWWWTCTPYSTSSNGNSYGARVVCFDGTLSGSSACYGDIGVRPLCTLQSSILVSPIYKEETSYTQEAAEDVENSTDTEEVAVEYDPATDRDPDGEELELVNGLIECIKKAQQDYQSMGGSLADLVNCTGAAINIKRMVNNE